jgi:hypothetical protein
VLGGGAAHADTTATFTPGSAWHLGPLDHPARPEVAAGLDAQRGPLHATGAEIPLTASPSRPTRSSVDAIQIAPH